MRVLTFCPHLGEGGADRVVVAILRHLDRRRFQPALALVRREGPFVADVPADVPIHVLGSRRTATSLPALVQLLRRERPDVIFSAHGAANIIVALAHGLARSPARLVLSERSALRRSDRSATRMALELPAKRLTYRRADLVTAVSSGVAADLATILHLPPSRIRVVDNPMVDDELATLAAAPIDHPWFGRGTVYTFETYGAEPREITSGEIPVIVAVGRLQAIKDYPTLLDAFARIRAVRPVRLAILGDGPLRGELEQRVRDLGLGDDVVFFGFDKNPFKYMARARLLLHASRAEGLPGALIQAMACGTPVVTTDCDFGPREVIDAPGTNGFLVPVGDAGALAARALVLLADAELRARVGAAARRTVQRYTTATAMAKYEAALAGDTFAP